MDLSHVLIDHRETTVHAFKTVGRSLVPEDIVGVERQVLVLRQGVVGSCRPVVGTASVNHITDLFAHHDQRLPTVPGAPRSIDFVDAGRSAASEAGLEGTPCATPRLWLSDPVSLTSCALAPRGKHSALTIKLALELQVLTLGLAGIAVHSFKHGSMIHPPADSGEPGGERLWAIAVDRRHMAASGDATPGRAPLEFR